MSGVAMEIIRIGRVLSTEYMDPYQMPYGSRPGSPSDHISVPIHSSSVPGPTTTIGIRFSEQSIASAYVLLLEFGCGLFSENGMITV